MRATVTTFPDLMDRTNKLIDALSNAGLTPKPTSRLIEYQRELAKAVPSKSAPSSYQLKRWHRLLIEVSDLFMVVQELSKPPAVRGWDQKMAEVLSGAFFSSGNSTNPRPRNTQFELVVAASLRSGGYEVQLEEPDIVAEMSVGSVGVAAKRPSSVANLSHTVRDAGQQIVKFCGPGLIAVDATILVNPDDGQFTTQDFLKTEATVAAHAIDVAKRIAAIAGKKVGTEYVFGVIARVCVPTWEPHIPRMSYIERWPVVALVGENDARYHCCRDLVVRLRAVT